MPHKIEGCGCEYYTDDEEKLHRDGDLPALIECDGMMRYYKHGKMHRENGAAYIYESENKIRNIKRYYLDGKEYKCGSDEEWKEIVKFKVFI